MNLMDVMPLLVQFQEPKLSATENGFTAEKGATFLQSVYEPTFTETP